MDGHLALRIIDTWAIANELSDLIDYRDFNLQPGETREIDGTDQLWVIEYADENMHIESEKGVYDLRNELLNENTHAHTGVFTVENRDDKAQNVSFIVGIGR